MRKNRTFNVRDTFFTKIYEYMHISPGVQPTKTRGLNIKHQIKLVPKCYKCIKLCPFVLYCCPVLI